MRKLKDSGIEWIGEIPQEWGVSKIKFVADFEPVCDFRNISSEDRIAYAPMECIKQGFYEARDTLYEEVSHSLTPFQNGDIVMAKVTPCFENGNIAIMDGLPSGIGLGSSELFVFRAKTILAKYLFYWLQNSDFIQRACSTMTGAGGLKRVSPFFCKNCDIHVPPYSEQRRIADYLDRKCSQIDAIIARQQEVVEKLKAYKLSVITEAVTKGLNPDVPMKDSGIEWIGKIPEHWNVAKMKFVSTFFNGDRSSKYPSGADIVDSGVIFVTSNNLGDIVLNTEVETKYITHEKYNDLGGAKLQLDDIIFCLRGSVGKCSINKTENEGTIASSLVTIRAEKILADYLIFVLQCPGVTAISTLNAIGIGSLNLSADDISEIVIPVPSQEDAKIIATYLDKKIGMIDKLTNKKKDCIDKLVAYKKSLIYEVVTGKKEV